MWCGIAGHFVAASKCLFHLNTRVGGYRISTIGEYIPDGKRDFDTLSIDGRLYETSVFRVNGFGECGDGQVESWSEIESVGYLAPIEAEVGHMAMCRKYAAFPETVSA